MGFELAYLNGVSGYGGKSNWYEDRDDDRPWLLEAMEKVPGMMQPWNDKKSELRSYDIPSKNYDEFEAFLHKYDETSGLEWKKQRFRELHNGNALISSRKVRLGFNKRSDLQEALLNYNGKSNAYNAGNPLKPVQMCQTFSADLFSYLTGHLTGVYSAIAKPFYRPHMHWFLYLPSYIEGGEDLPQED